MTELRWHPDKRLCFVCSPTAAAPFPLCHKATGVLEKKEHFEEVYKKCAKGMQYSGRANVRGMARVAGLMSLENDS